MLDEVKAIEPQLKQILYGCVEHVQATKAALYLSTSHDLNEKTYELVTSYQYNAADRRVVTANDDLVDRLAVKRSPFYVNGLGADMRFSEMLFRQGNDRLLATPLFARGRLLGFIDMRDKAGKKPFESNDLEEARKIGEEVLNVLSGKQLFGLAPIPLSAADPSQRAPASPATPSTPGTAAVTTPVETARTELSPQAMQAIRAAREIMSKRQLSPAAALGKRAMTEHDVDVLRLMLPAALMMPGAVAAAISAVGQVNNPQALVALANVADDSMEMLLAHVREWLKRANQHHVASRPQTAFPFGMQPAPISAAAISTIVSAAVNTQTVDGLVLTAVFERTAEGQAQRAMQVFLKQMEPSIDAVLSSSGGRADKQVIADKLLEPDFQRYPELVDHARQVSALAQRFATLLDLPAPVVETIRIAALVHDVGLRLLDYDRINRRPRLSAEEMRGIAEHPIIGAALVEPLLGSDVAQAVLRHHERVDGKGYPSRMSGATIPLSARVLAICDSWIAMTSRTSYQPPIPHDEAMTKLRDAAGTQLDATLVDKFLSSLESLGV